MICPVLISSRHWRASVIASRGKPAAIRVSTKKPTQHHVTVPAHDPLKVGTLSGILSDVSVHLQISRDELQRQIFGGSVHVQQL